MDSGNLSTPGHVFFIIISPGPVSRKTVKFNPGLSQTYLPFILPLTYSRCRFKTQIFPTHSNHLSAHPFIYSTFNTSAHYTRKTAVEIEDTTRLRGDKKFFFECWKIYQTILLK